MQCFMISNSKYIAFIDDPELVKKVKALPIMKWARIKPCFQVYWQWVQDYIWRVDLPIPFFPDGFNNKNYYNGPPVYAPIPLFGAPKFNHRKI